VKKKRDGLLLLKKPPISPGLGAGIFPFGPSSLNNLQTAISHE
jgi:hypothetical protein